LNRVRVLAYRDNGRAWRQVTMTQTDASGAYRLTDLAPGIYRLRFTLNRYRTEYYDDVNKLSLARDVVVTANTVTSNINAILARTRARVRQDAGVAEANLRVEIADAENGELLPDAVVTLYQVLLDDAGICPATAPADPQADATWFDEGAGEGVIEWEVAAGCWFGVIEAETYAETTSGVVAVGDAPATLTVTATPLTALFMPVIER
jgi:hypothetical protein